MNERLVQIKNLHVREERDDNESEFGISLPLWGENALLSVDCWQHIVAGEILDQNHATCDEEEGNERIVLVLLLFPLRFRDGSDGICRGQTLLHVLFTVVRGDVRLLLLVLDRRIDDVFLLQLLSLLGFVTRRG